MVATLAVLEAVEGRPVSVEAAAEPPVIIPLVEVEATLVVMEVPEAVIQPLLKLGGFKGRARVVTAAPRRPVVSEPVVVAAADSMGSRIWR
jgi:hypothetical protein